MWSIFYFLTFIFLFTLIYNSINVKSLVSFFFFSEIIWIILFTSTNLLGSIYDDLALYSLGIIILFITAMEVGIISLFLKIFGNFILN